MKRIRKPSPALVVASLALLVALGGTSVAAVSVVVPRNSVGTAQLKTNAVTGAKVKNHSLTLADFLGRGPVGPPGPAGPAGPAGSSSGFDTAKLHVKNGPIVTVAGGATGGGDYACDTNQVALSVGVSSTFRWNVVQISPVDSTKWTVKLANPTASTSQSFQAVLLCYG
jgi:hypothetical protein